MKIPLRTIVTILWLTGLVLCVQSTSAQREDDPVLFTVGDEEVRNSEFRYIYEKNASESPSYDRASIREYLELYEAFKLKVHHARELGLDDSPELKAELAKYRQQLAEGYLNDKKVMDRLTFEAWQRSQKEAEISHILIRMPGQIKGADTLRQYQAAKEIYDELIKGADFDDVVKSKSQDIKTKDNGGYLGFVKAVLPRGYYNLETAIYSLEPGELSAPVRSPRGYHIIRLESYRMARPEVDIAHILIRKKKGQDDQEARQKIDAIYQELLNGASFEDLATAESQDASTARQGGRIGLIKTGDYETGFEEAAYSLESDGAFTEPVETRIGFHILQRLGINEIPGYDVGRKKIESELRTTERQDIARQSMVNRIKEEEGMEVNHFLRRSLFEKFDADILNYKWNDPDLGSETFEELVTCQDGDSWSGVDFINHIKRKPRERASLRRSGLEGALQELFDQWTEELCFQIEKSKLEEKHPEFATLMTEYEEGILLFEVTKDKIWERASNDTTGLRAYFDDHRDQYMTSSEAEIVTFTLADVNEKEARKIARKIKKKSPEELKKLYPNVPQDVTTLSRDDGNASEYPWKENQVTDPKPFGSTGRAFLVSKTNKIIPAERQKLEECRGYVISDYQVYLEKEWVKELKKMYPIEHNEQAFKELVE